MAAVWETDSKGRSHYMLRQELKNSCGPACVAMAEGIYKMQCMIDPEKRAREISKQYPKGFKEEEGTYPSNLAYVLNHIGVRAYKSEGVGGPKIFDYFWHYVGGRTPIIAQIKWSGNKGAHFALLTEIDRATHRMIFYDPWYGLVELDRKDLPNYSKSGASGVLNGWMTITYR